MIRLPSIIVQRVALAVVGVGMAAGFMGEWSAHHRAERRYASLLATSRQLELQLGRMSEERDRLSGALTTAQQHVDEISQAYTDKSAALERATAQVQEHARTINELGNVNS